MSYANLGWSFISGCLAWLITWRVRRYALAHRMLDLPNERSSHAQPVPRGGGLSIVITVEIGLAFLFLNSSISLQTLLALGLGSLMVASVGLIDDRHGLPALYRLCVHTFAAIIAVSLLLQQPNTQAVFGDLPAWFAFVLLVLGIVWSTNLFNFMDGIDGIAASQAVFVSLTTAALISLRGPDTWAMGAWVAGGASLGFLVWNWPPAKIFMGDVGSGFLGFWLSAFGVALHLHDLLNIWVSITLASLFIADATVTLLMRVARRERVYEAHRSHAYQNLARRLGSHAKVSGIAWLINLVIVFPAAYACSVQEEIGPWIAIGVILLLTSACLMQGAGRQPQ